MGQKVSPHGFRVGVIKDWSSKWYASKQQFGDLLVEDNKIRNYIKKKLYVAGISNILIERAAEDKIRVTLWTSKPGMVIGRGASGIDELKQGLSKLTGKNVDVSIEEVRRAELDAQLTAENIAEQLERRVAFRRAMKFALQRTMKAEAKGIKILVSGRLGGAEIARSEKYSEGNVPLHTLRANIDYGFAEADTTYGKIGVKVWINHGEVLDKGLQGPEKEERRDKKERKQRRDGKKNDRRRRDNKNDRNRAPEIVKAANKRIRPVKQVEEAPQVEEQVVEATEQTTEE